MGCLLEGARAILDIDDFVAGPLEEGLDPLTRRWVVVGDQDVRRPAFPVDSRGDVRGGMGAGQGAYRLGQLDGAVVQILEVLATLLDTERMRPLVEQDAGKADQRVESRVDEVTLLGAGRPGHRRRLRQADHAPLALLAVLEQFTYLLHFFALGMDLGR